MKKYVMFILLLMLVHILDAQEIEPSQQAQGYLDNKNTTMDYSVGIFHYTIPLFEVTSGEYRLPVSLDYAGRGVHGYDMPGIVGFNWTLNAGGVITRVARGGPDSGVNRIFSVSDTSNINLMEAINLRGADAEADIFTASFNNKKVDFYIKNGADRLVATPLEQTNVKILVTGGSELSWQIIDEDGCEYFFTQLEEFRNFQREDDSSMKNQYFESYISSWYLSRIVVPNQDTIYLEYIDGKELFSIQDSVFNGFTTYDKQWVRYDYGKSFREYPFDFMRNSYQFEEYMIQAADMIRNDAQKQYLNNFHSNMRYSMDNYTGIFVRNEMYETINEQNLRMLEYQQKIAGILTDISKVNQASQGLIDALNNMMSDFRYTYPSVVTCLDLAKRVVKEDIKFSWEVTWKKQWLNSGYSLKSPFLKSIYTLKQKINFDYTLVSGKYPFLTRLQMLENETLSSIVKIQVDANKKLLRSVEFQGKDARSYAKTQFNYYHEGTEIKSFDRWGYFTDPKGSDPMMDNSIDPNYIKKFSLQSITNNLGGEIRLDYEPNMIGEEYTGGIRVKQIITRDGINHSDTVLYNYPLPGVLVYDGFSRVEYMNYGSIVDQVTHSRVSSRGNCYVNTGNNGIYYPYVQEVSRGKGMNAYLFSVASPSCKNTWFTYPWWLSGVLLGKASYDRENRLVSVQRMNYYATTSLSPEFTGKSFFEELPGCFAFDKAEGQIKAYPSYTKNPYYNESYLVYRDPMDPVDREFYVNPYSCFDERQVTLVPSSFKPFYQLFYGGKTVLKEQKEYLFSYTPVTVGPEQIERPENVQGGQLVNRTEFYYDNAEQSVSPTRIIQTRSNGDQIVTYRYTPLEFSSQTSAVIQGMKEKNILTPVLKELTLGKQAGESNYRVVKDVVHEYDEYNESGKKVYLLKKELERSCDNSQLIPTLPTFPAPALLSDGVYVQNISLNYRMYGYKWLPNEVSSRTEKVGITYSVYNKELLRTPEVNQVSKDVQTGCTSPYTTFYRRLFVFVSRVDKAIKPDDYREDFRGYLKSDYYRGIREFMQKISYMGMSPKEIIGEQSEIRGKYLPAFIEYFMTALRLDYIIPSLTISDFEVTVDALTFLATVTENEINKFCTAVLTCTNDQELIGYPVYEYVNIDLEAKPTEKNYKVFLYARPLQAEIQVKYDITVGSNKTSASRTLAGTPGVFQLLSFDITLPTGQIDKLGVKIPEEAQAVVAVLIPKNIQFQAQGYDRSDRLICKFDQLENVEGYEYDMANRLIRVRDKDRNVLKEWQYNLMDVPHAHVVEKVNLDPAANSKSRNKMIYYDGFGRKLQGVLVRASPVSNGDIVTPCVYGPFGKVEKEYLPYSKNSNNGAYDENAFAISNWNIYGAGENAYTFTSTSYDNSPLDRVIKKMGPGKAWHVVGKGVSMSYGFNGISEVRLYRVTNNGNLENRGYYTAGTLQKTIVTDEDACRAETFTDNTGKTVLSVSIEGSNRLETYSVYDDRGLLRWVLSPEASSQLGTSVNEAVLQRLAYRYDYDGLGRMTVKCLPGCDPVYMVYDKKDRLVMSQDGRQRAMDAKKWSYSLYDSYNRVTESGEVVLSVAKSHSVLLSEAFTSDNYVPSGTRTALQRSLYDTYTGTSEIPVYGFVPTNGYAADYTRSVTGLVTSIKTRVLETGEYLTTTTYYDDRGRVIQTINDNLQGGKSRVDFKYDFVGNILQQRESHQVSSTRTDVLEIINTYDDWGRLLTSTSKLNNGTSALVVYTRDAIGRLTTKRLGNVTETMSYNTRGWLTGKESAPFKMKLRYESPQGGNTAHYNGNVGEWEWQQGTSAALMYGFTYDGVNRLTETIQKQVSGTSWGAMSGSYLEKGLTYDCIVKLRKECNLLEMSIG